MRWLVALGLALLLGLSGCSERYLRFATVSQASTLSELQYKMVLENLAALQDRPGILPWHVSISGGTTQATDIGEAQVFFGLNSAYGASGTRSIVQQWGFNPVTDPDALRLLQIAYRRTMGSTEMPDADFLDDVAHRIKLQIIATEDLKSQSAYFYQSETGKRREPNKNALEDIESTLGDETIYEPRENRASPPPRARKSPLAREVAHEIHSLVEDLAGIPTGWFHVGRKHDVPKDACYVAHQGPTYVWVDAAGMEGLSGFTLAVLDLATTIQPPQVFGSPGGGVSYSPGFEQID
jgi:hypothetical protein